MLELGLDPATIVAEERLRQREVRNVTSTKGGRLAKLTRDQGLHWYAEIWRENGFYIEIQSGGIPLESFLGIGLELVEGDNGTDSDGVIFTYGTFMDPEGSNLYDDLVNGDQILSIGKIYPHINNYANHN